ncbi:Ferredoxin, 2Fe-2S [Rubripirellula lacrimiformis]|uniref:Ferredoxin, 2Fe-2S n=1 Tax=Rubripirellula lacrimiformis TaxID=1930273 RepID=A0A517NEJ7_9BACT|nr:hypothetical protein [Rubripirellula lacrimiformis]QDT05540.1 Ferredoxin, 2Fe-2S [Rubripirellula lacrimiformis]
MKDDAGARKSAAESPADRSGADRLAPLPKPDLKSARSRSKKLGLGPGQKVILMCMDRKTAKCASGKEMAAAWKHLKSRMKQWGLKSSKSNDSVRAMRVAVGCIGVCRGGPIMAVMPDGLWYGSCTPQVIDRILKEHVIDGRPVTSHLISPIDLA